MRFSPKKRTNWNGFAGIARFGGLEKYYCRIILSRCNVMVRNN